MIYGLDVGGTKTEIAIFDRNLNKVDSWRIATPKLNYPLFLSALTDMVLEADRKFDVVGSLGVGMVGVIDSMGRSLSANVPCANGKLIADDLTKLLQRPVAISNDTRCFALSEAAGGAGEGYARMFGAIIGTGAAGGLCVNGELYKSANGIAGEYGHHPIGAHIQQKYKLPILSCGCGLVGCLEKYISGPGLAYLYGFFSEKENATAHECIEAYRKKEPIAIKAFSCYMDILGSSFASLVMDYDPDVIVIGGGISQLDEVLLTLPSAIRPHLFRGVNIPVIVRAKFGDSSGVRGAAILGSQLCN
ncbi:MAG: ROK family protein [Cellvibrio sp.]|uniref:ROK family protein n=1 Tax=Cellvibrio sp. TaxID=1965322 RepID=UPI0031A8378B